MKLEHAQTIIEAADEIGGLDLQLDDHYSGRCMYGGKTAAIIGDLATIIRCIALAGYNFGRDDKDVEVDQFVDAMSQLSFDTMGRSDSGVY